MLQIEKNHKPSAFEVRVVLGKSVQTRSIIYQSSWLTISAEDLHEGMSHAIQVPEIYCTLEKKEMDDGVLLTFK